MSANDSRGISTLGVIALTAVILIGIVIFIILYTARGQADRDGRRRSHLQTLGLAEEYYFDRLKTYGTAAELTQAGLLPADIKDPETGLMYQLYLNNLSDEWCAWAGSEANPAYYFIQHEAGAGTVNNQPINLATCKSSL